MRLWHEELIPYLPRQQLLGQHRECCALRGLGWGRKHATVDYVFRHPYGWLVAYHFEVTLEMERRGYKNDPAWDSVAYRGKKCDPVPVDDLSWQMAACENRFLRPGYIYPEHDDVYLQECLENLARKGIKIDMEVKP